MMPHAHDIDPEEEARLEILIQARLSGRVRGLRVVHRDNSIILQGRTSTYYAKQLVLHVAMQASPLPISGDEIEVDHASERRHAGCE